MKKYIAMAAWNDLAGSDPFTDLRKAFSNSEFDEVVVSEILHKALVFHPLTEFYCPKKHPFIPLWKLPESVEFLSKIFDPVKYTVENFSYPDEDICLLKLKGEIVAIIEQPAHIDE